MKITRLAAGCLAIALSTAFLSSASAAMARRDPCVIRHAFPVAKGEIDSGGPWSVVADGSALGMRSLVVATASGGSASMCAAGSSYRDAVAHGPHGFVFMEKNDQMGAPVGVLFGMLPREARVLKLQMSDGSSLAAVAHVPVRGVPFSFFGLAIRLDQTITAAHVEDRRGRTIVTVEIMNAPLRGGLSEAPDPFGGLAYRLITDPLVLPLKG